MSTHPVRNKVAAITGAGSGIGRALAVELSRRGAAIAISDVNEVGLEETAALITGAVHSAVVDVSDRDAVQRWANDVNGHFGRVNQIYNNAGIALHRNVSDSDWTDYQRVFGINLNGVIHGTQAFLPHLIASGDGAVINVSSINGVFAQPGTSHYCAAKFAVRGFTEALRTEMLLTGQPVRVSVVHPGGIATDISSSAFKASEPSGQDVSAAVTKRQRIYREKLLKMPPSTAAQIIVGAVERGKPRILVGSDAVALDLITRLAPSLAAHLAVQFDRRLMSSDVGVKQSKKGTRC
jgi:NAD(P)-dependent dehydrogenase (short-subunit alcohol dehydrogenase family)